jgi:phosphoglucosamine mutase
VFEELGAEVIAIGDQPDGLNINAGVGSTYIENLQQEVIASRADLGVALDGDGDRVIMVDGEGKVLDGDDILYIIAQARQSCGGLVGSVVGTVMTNLGLEHALAKLGIGLERVQVGDRFIMEKLEAEGWVLGGEPSGHIICLDRTTTGDGIVSALQVLAEVVRTGKSLSELRSPVVKYPQELINVRLENGVDVMGSAIMQEAVQDAESELSDQGRVLLRPSGTEPLIRVMVEGSDQGQVKQLSEKLADVARELVAAG